MVKCCLTTVSSCAGEDKGVSPVGMTQTLPEEDADVEKLRMAVFSCSNLPYGFFNAYVPFL